MWAGGIPAAVGPGRLVTDPGGTRCFGTDRGGLGRREWDDDGGPITFACGAHIGCCCGARAGCPLECHHDLDEQRGR
jgi:hypothetical protein